MILNFEEYGLKTMCITNRRMRCIEQNNINTFLRDTSGLTLKEWCVFAEQHNCYNLLSVLFGINLRDYDANDPYIRVDIKPYMNEHHYSWFKSKCEESKIYKLFNGAYEDYKIFLACTICDVSKRINIGDINKNILGTKLYNELTLDEYILIDLSLLLVSPVNNNIKLHILSLMVDINKHIRVVKQPTKNVWKSETIVNNIYEIPVHIWKHYCEAINVDESILKRIYGKSPYIHSAQISDTDSNNIIALVPKDFLHMLYDSVVLSGCSVDYIRKISPLFYLMYNTTNKWYRYVNMDFKYLSKFDSILINEILRGDKLLESIAIQLAPSCVLEEQYSIHPRSRTRLCEAIGVKIIK